MIIVKRLAFKKNGVKIELLVM